MADILDVVFDKLRDGAAAHATTEAEESGSGPGPSLG